MTIKKITAGGCVKYSIRAKLLFRPATDFWNWLLLSVKKPENFPAYLTAIFTVALAGFAYLAWREAQATTAIFADQLKAAQKQLQVMRDQQRPWVYVDVSPADPVARSSEDGWNFSVKLTYRNVGQEAALHLWSTAKAVIITTLNAKLGDDQELLCSSNEGPSDHTFAGSTLFPGQTLQAVSMVNVPTRPWKDTAKNGRALAVVGCVRYTAGETQHRSKFAYVFGLRDNGVIKPLPIDLTAASPRNLDISRWFEDGAFDAD
jgi:hypothetical protein